MRISRFVSIVMPVLNEELYLSDAVNSLGPTGDSFKYEIIIVDGGSTDRTVEIAKNLASHDPRIQVVHNPGRIQSSGVNIGVRIADPRADVIVRADCHALYPPRFVESLVHELERTGAQSVVVTLQTVGNTFLQKAIAGAQNSVLGTGGSPHRSGRVSGFIDHGHHAAFLRDSFQKIGGYDETFSHNEDAEYDYRLVAQGGRIWLNVELPVTYYPRATFGTLARQYYKHGRGRAKTIVKHRLRPKLRQIAPVLVLIASLLAVPLGLFVHWSWLLVIVAYVAGCVSVGFALAVSQRDPSLVASGLAAVVMHQSWAAGFLSTMGSSLRSRWWPSSTVQPKNA